MFRIFHVLQNLKEPQGIYLQVKWQGQIIADTKEAYWVLETYHAPKTPLKACLINKIPYNLPKSSLSIPITPTKKSTFCEWKGWATYYSISLPSSTQSSQTIQDRIWTYENPTSGFKDLKGFVSLYAGPWECFIEGEQVVPQPGEFYGGWTTSELEGIIKGSQETRWM